MRALSLALAAAAANAELYTTHMKRANETIAQLGSAVASYPTQQAVAGKNGWAVSTYSGWTSGFWPGILFKLYNYTLAADPAASAHWLSAATAAVQGLAPERFDTGTHDVGFVMYTSWGQLWHLTKDPTAREYLVTTADSLSTRFSPIVGCLRSWNTPKSLPADYFEVIADNLLNLELLWWAGQETGNATYTNIAHSHSRHMIRDLFQPFNPGCAWHLITYSGSTGKVLNRSSTPQGLGLNTVWARGQSWALNGFTIAHRFTREAEYLLQAEQAADCFLRLLAQCCGESTAFHWAPLWDFKCVWGLARSLSAPHPPPPPATHSHTPSTPRLTLLPPTATHTHITGKQRDGVRAVGGHLRHDDRGGGAGGAVVVLCPRPHVPGRGHHPAGGR